jgi:nitrogen regulatory protein P-II 2
MITKHPKRLLVVIAEAAIEKPLVQEALRLGAHGYTVSDVRGAGASGAREGAWEADRTIEIKIVCDTEVADAIAEAALSRFGSHYGLTMFFGDVQVLRPEKF